jgi:hypothetical protein
MIFRLWTALLYAKAQPDAHRQPAACGKEVSKIKGQNI